MRVSGVCERGGEMYIVCAWMYVYMYAHMSVVRSDISVTTNRVNT